MGFFSFLKKQKSTKPSETIDEPIDFECMYPDINEIGIIGYKPTHIATCKKIWHDYVPDRGQSEILQGELLRQLEKLRYEAQNNGNMNWDDNFDLFCTFIKDTLLNSGLFDEDYEDKLARSLESIRNKGRYALSYQEGEISDDEVNPLLCAYVDNNLYDYIADAIAIFTEANPEPIMREIDNSIYR